tara:strand:- start:32 stop:445 length:414 start_codon:yes stop_codon:yes gene_type:complete
MTFRNQPRGREAGFVPLGQHKNLRPRPKKDVQNFERTMAVKSGYMPNNPDNVESFTDGDKVVHQGIYGLEVRVNDPTLPKVATPDQQGTALQGSIVRPNADVQANNIGFMSPIAPPMGMSTGIGLMGSGPQRNVPKE